MAWPARLIKPYYPRCLIAIVCVPLPLPPLAAGKDVYPRNYWQAERGIPFLAGNIPQWNVFILFRSPLLTSLMNGFTVVTLEKLVCFKSVMMKRRSMCACPLTSPHSPALGWQVCGGYLWISLWDRENVVLDRHGKGIRQMCCCVWVDRAPGFYCCSSRGPKGPLNLAVKFWESQR